MAYGVSLTSDVAYGSTSTKQKLDIYQPVGASGARPAIVIIHGGGWSGGDKTDAARVAQAIRYAQLGYVAVSINYRLATANVWPTQINDVQLAIRYLRSVAATHNIDTHRFAVFGDSAGGQLALMAAVLTGIHSGDQSGQLTGFSSAVQLTIDQFGPADMVKMYNESSQQSAVTGLFGGNTPTNDASDYADASAVGQVTSAMGPVFITQGTADGTVPQDQSQGLYAALQAANVDVVYRSYPGDHEYGLLTNAQADTIYREIQAFIQGQFPVT